MRDSLLRRASRSSLADLRERNWPLTFLGYEGNTRLGAGYPRATSAAASRIERSPTARDRNFQTPDDLHHRHRAGVPPSSGRRPCPDSTSDALAIRPAHALTVAPEAFRRTVAGHPKADRCSRWHGTIDRLLRRPGRRNDCLMSPAGSVVDHQRGS